jgi:hypothetical protein
MRFYPPDQPVPPGLQTGQFLLEPLAPKHCALDYAAVMASKAQLRLWGGHGWPADNFTLQDNMKDMQFHYREHKERAAFTYTVLSPERDACLGCVYIRSLGELAASGVVHTAVQHPPDYHAMLRFWVRTSCLAQDYDRGLLHTLREWQRRDWPFRRILVHTPEMYGRQITLFQEAALPHAFTLEFPGRGGTHQFFDLLP